MLEHVLDPMDIIGLLPELRDKHCFDSDHSEIINVNDQYVPQVLLIREPLKVSDWIYLDNASFADVRLLPIIFVS